MTIESRIENLERSVKKEVKGVVKGEDLQNVKDELLETIIEKMQTLAGGGVEAKSNEEE